MVPMRLLQGHRTGAGMSALDQLAERCHEGGLSMALYHDPHEEYGCTWSAWVHKFQIREHGATPWEAAAKARDAVDACRGTGQVQPAGGTQ